MRIRSTNLGHLAPCGWEPVVISLNCLLLNMNSTNETLLFDRFLIMYNLCVFTCIIFIFCVSLYTCANVICIKLLLTYLLTYLLDLGKKQPMQNDWRDVERLKLQCIAIATFSSWTNFRFRQNCLYLSLTRSFRVNWIPELTSTRFGVKNLEKSLYGKVRYFEPFTRGLRVRQTEDRLKRLEWLLAISPSDVNVSVNVNSRFV